VKGTAANPFRASSGLLVGSEPADIGDSRRWHIDWNDLLGGFSITSVTWSVAAGLSKSNELTSAGVTSVIVSSAAAQKRAYRVSCDIVTGGNERLRRSFELVFGDSAGVLGSGATPGGTGVTDHGSLTGLADDDHPQYALVSGSRAFTGDLSAGGFSFKDLAPPVDPDDAASKDYVDTELGAAQDGVSITLNGSSKLQRAALTGDVTATAGSNTTAIAAGVIVNADVNAAAAIAGTKISPDFGSQNILTTGFITMAATPAATGSVRWGSNAAYSIKGRTSGGGDQTVLQWDAAVPRIYLGANETVFSHIYFNTNNLQLRVGSDYVAQLTTTSFLLNNNIALNILAGNALNIFPLDSAGGGATGGALNTHAGDSTSGAGGGTGGSRFDRAGNQTGVSGTRNGGDYDVQAGGGGTASGTFAIRTATTDGTRGTKRIAVDNTGIGFFNTAPVAQPTVTGSKASGAALADLLTKLANLGLIVDGTSA
jgi:hypothetical protein